MRTGRPRVATTASISRAALELFLEKGFDQTTLDDIAEVSGVSRRTLLRYFASKSDIPWGDFDDELADMIAFLAGLPPEVEVLDGVRRAVLRFNTIPAAEVGPHRTRMRLLFSVPKIVAHSMLRYDTWRQVVADFVAARLRLDPAGLEAQTFAFAALGATLTAYQQWLGDEDADLLELIERSFDALALLHSPGDGHSRS